MHIREAKKSDSEILATLCITVWVDTYCFEGIEPAHAKHLLEEYTANSLAERIQNKLVFVAELNKRVVGLIVLDSDTDEIETLYVLPRFKGMGAGKLLVERAKNSVSNRVFLTCWEGNSQALKFYEKLGFVVSGEVFFVLEGTRIRNLELTSS